MVLPPGSLLPGFPGYGLVTLFGSDDYESEVKQLVRIIARVRDWNVLTASNIGNFAQREGIIGFTREKDEIHFEINFDASKMAGLRISLRILKLSRIISVNPKGMKK